MKHIINSIIEVFSDYKYIVTSLTIFILFILFNTLAINYKFLLNNFSFGLVYQLVIGGFNSMTVASIISLITIAMLSGILLSMVIYKVKSVNPIDKVDKKSGFLGGIAIVLGTLVPACGACGIGVLALLGYGSLLAALPFLGLEMAIFSIILLLVSIHFISKQIQKKTC